MSTFLSAPVYRRDKHVRLALPDAFADCELHAYLMVCRKDGRWSPTLYVECPAPGADEPDDTDSSPQPVETRCAASAFFPFASN